MSSSRFTGGSFSTVNKSGRGINCCLSSKPRTDDVVYSDTARGRGRRYRPPVSQLASALHACEIYAAFTPDLFAARPTNSNIIVLDCAAVDKRLRGHESPIARLTEMLGVCVSRNKL